MKRRSFTQILAASGGAISLLTLPGCDSSSSLKAPKVPLLLTENMYQKALDITQSKVRGGEDEPFFKVPFIDAAFSKNLFLWDTCFMVCFAKYHTDILPVAQALDNFYTVQEDDGYICREYRPDGRPLWSKDHPVSINPPLLAWAELELHSVIKDLKRLKRVYPKLKKNFEFLVDRYQGDDHLFWGDTLGMGMDNIPRYPRDWDNDGDGLTHEELDAKVAALNAPAADKLQLFIDEYPKTRQGQWNKQGRLVDFTAQMAMLALQLNEIAGLLGIKKDTEAYLIFHQKIKGALNKKCWNEKDQYYYDLGYDFQLKRKHIGMYWTLLADLVPEERKATFIAHLNNEQEFNRLMPLPALSADDPDYKGWGDYWLGGVWAPTSYMVLKGLTKQGYDDLAHDLAARTYRNVATVYSATGTFWENYAPDLVSYGMPARKDFCGWTGLIPIAVYQEYLIEPS